MQVFVARQAIFDTKKRVVAYELLFRSGMENAFPKGMNGDVASALRSIRCFRLCKPTPVRLVRAIPARRTIPVPCLRSATVLMAAWVQFVRYPMVRAFLVDRI